MDYAGNASKKVGRLLDFYALLYILIMFSRQQGNILRAVSEMGCHKVSQFGRKNGFDSQGVTIGAKSFLSVSAVAQGTIEVFSKVSSVFQTDSLSATII